MWEYISDTRVGREYIIELLREFNTDSRHISGAWISTLTIRRDKEMIFYYRMGTVVDKMDERDREVYQEIIEQYN